ncbi:MAG: hypothetical protein ACE5FG_00180 [Myxococcota bacterium]
MRTDDPPRLGFVEAHEVPRLILGVLRGDPVSLRRLLGARRSGRWGCGLALAALLLAVPEPSGIAIVAAAHLALALYVVIPRTGALPLRARQELTLSLWAASPLFALVAALRPLGLQSLALPLAATLLAHLHIARTTRSGDVD